MTARVLSAYNGLPRAVRLISALGAASAGGFAAGFVHLPLHWLLGSLGLAAILTLSGLDLGLSDWVRRAGQIMAGFSVGLYFTPTVGARVLEMGGWMVLTGIISILASLLISIGLARLGRCDRDSAYFAMLPGGLAEMAGLAERFGANVTLVSVSQTFRVIVIVLTLPPLLVLFLGEANVALPEHQTLSWAWTVGGLALATAVGFVLQWGRIFNAWLLGGLAAGIGFGLALNDQSYAPDLIRIGAQVAIGGALGTRFKWAVMRKAGLGFLAATILATLALIAFNAGVATLFAGQVGLGAAILATAPGGIAEMSLTAELLNLAPPVVTAWQLVRILLVALVAGPLFRLYQRFG